MKSMNHQRKLYAFLFLFLGVALTFSLGCDRFKKKKISHLVVAPGQTPEEVFKKGEKFLKKKRYEDAIEHFEAVKNNFPLSPLAAEAELQAAEAYFNWKQYDQSAETYNLFQRLHPLHAKTDYAMMRQGEALYKDSPKTIDRDLTSCRQSVTVLNNFFRRYPLSQYTDKAREIVWECRRRIAGQEYYVGRFYYRTRKMQASIGRLEGVLRDHSGFGYDEKAAWYLGLAYYREKEFNESKRVFEQLINHFPQSPYREKAQKRMKRINKKLSKS
jgi:outer membrane protein assembly factor BamD